MPSRMRLAQVGRRGYFSRERRETGKEHVVKVHCDEGVATHIGPESCAGAREGIREALTGECTGQPSSRERNNSRAPTQSSTRKATRTGAQFASARTARRGQRPWHAQRSLHGNREVSRPTVRYAPPVRMGKARSRSP